MHLILTQVSQSVRHTHVVQGGGDCGVVTVGNILWSLSLSLPPNTNMMPQHRNGYVKAALQSVSVDKDLPLASERCSTTVSSVFCSSSRNFGPMVRRSQPASARISPKNNRNETRVTLVSFCKIASYSLPGSTNTTGRCYQSLTSIPEGGSHDNSLVTKLLIVVVDLSNTLHTRIIFRLIGFLIRVSHIPGYKSLHAVKQKINN